MSPRSDDTTRKGDGKDSAGLSPETTRNLLVGVLMAGLVAFAYVRLVYVPLRHKVDGLRQEFEKADRTYRTNKTLAESFDTIRQRFRQTGSRLAGILTNELPPHENAAAWVGDLVIETAMQSPPTIDIQSITAENVLTFRKQKGMPPPMFEECLFRIELTAPYHDFGKFLARLEGRAPYMRVDSLHAKRKDLPGQKHTGPPRLEIELVCAFPRVTRDVMPAERTPEVRLREIEKSGSDKETDAGEE